MWHSEMKELANQKKLVILGITQEQHPDRCRLFAQWHQLNWPILHDPINILGPLAVPIFVAVDEHGVVRSTRPTPEWIRNKFVETKYEALNGIDATSTVASSPTLEELQRKAKQSQDFASWMRLGDASLQWPQTKDLDLAIEAYSKATSLDSDNSEAYFRLGVAFRMRHDSRAPSINDFQLAADNWSKALELRPNHYIYRRRIQQYGPRLIKPYPFYDWVNQARREILGRGEQPTPLPVEPSGAEIATPAKSAFAKTRGELSPDPNGRIARDRDRLILLTATVVPSRIRPGETTRVHVEFIPTNQAGWNNESEPLRVWLQIPKGWQADRQLLEAELPSTPESHEKRRIEFELKAPETLANDHTMNAYALYYSCEKADGTCLYLRQDFQFTIGVVK